MKIKTIKNNHNPLATLVAAGAFLVASVPAQAETYTFTDLGTLGGGYSEAVAINASGQVVGMSWTADNARHATLWDGGTPADLTPSPNTDLSYAYAINASGQAVGESRDVSVSLNSHATLWNGTTQTDLGLPSEYKSQAKDINASGQVVGWSTTKLSLETPNNAMLWNGSTATNLGTAGVYSKANAINDSGQVVGILDATLDADGVSDGVDGHATLWNGTISTDLGTLGGSYSTANAINASGQVVGISDTASGDRHATIWNGTAATDLGTLGGSLSEAYDINASGQVVGFSLGGSGGATLWNGTIAIDLNTLANVPAGWALNIATGINDNGWIVGTAVNIDNTDIRHAFLLTPVPVPAAAWLFGSAMLTVFGLRKRQAS